MLIVLVKLGVTSLPNDLKKMMITMLFVYKMKIKTCPDIYL